MSRNITYTILRASRWTSRLLFYISLLSMAALSQVEEGPEFKVFNLVVEVEANVWNIGDPAFVNIGIENISNANVGLDDGLTFNIIGDKDETGFWAPMSLSKTYLSYLDTCQDNIHEGTPDIRIVNGKIYRSDPEIRKRVDLPILKAREIITRRLNLSDFCWGKSTSSIYPSSSIYSIMKNGTHKLYFESMNHRSNVVDISFKDGDEQEGR